MNRILFERDEIRDGVAAFGGARARHIAEVLHGEVGQILKTGEIGGRTLSGKRRKLPNHIMCIRE